MGACDPNKDDVSLLERVAATDFESAKELWEDFLSRTLQTELIHYYAAKEIIAAGAWRKARNPMGYVRVAVRRLVKRSPWLNDDRGKSKFEAGCIADFYAPEDTRSFEDFIDHLHHKNTQRYAGQEAPERAKTQASLSFLDLRLLTGTIDWRAALDQCGADEEMQEYVLDRLYGIRGTAHTEATRKRFQRALPALRSAIMHNTYDRYLRRCA